MEKPQKEAITNDLLTGLTHSGYIFTEDGLAWTISPKATGSEMTQSSQRCISCHILTHRIIWIRFPIDAATSRNRRSLEEELVL
jgi:hypothetical protein